MLRKSGISLPAQHENEPAEQPETQVTKELKPQEDLHAEQLRSAQEDLEYTKRKGIKISFP